MFSASGATVRHDGASILHQRIDPIASRSLKHLSRRPLRYTDIMKVLNDSTEMPDQALALLDATMVERMLERVILSRMTRLRRTQRLELFDGLGPLSSFSAKIKIAHALAILGPKAVKDFEIIKEVRNAFAHSFHPLTFARKEIAAYCDRLYAPQRVSGLGGTRIPQQWPPTEPRLQYHLSCWLYFVGFGGKKANGPRPKRSRDSVSKHLLS